MTKMILTLSKLIWRSRRALVGVLIIFTISPIVFFTIDRAKMVIEDLRGTNRIRRRMSHGKVTECRMPEFDPFAFNNENEKTANLQNLTCEAFEWVNCYKSKCSVIKDILKSKRDVVCVYRDIITVGLQNFYFARPIKVIGDEKYLLNRSDHVKVECSGMELYGNNIHSRWSGFKTGFRRISKKKHTAPERVNVMILCFDSISRNAFIRKMYNSYKYLTEKLNAVILNSYNIIGDGTNGAVYPILTGIPEDELLAEDSEMYSSLQVTTQKQVDVTKFIFHLLKKYGYRTAYFEALPWTGTTIEKFSKQPAEHYLRPLWMANTSEDTSWPRKIPKSHCVGTKPQYQFMLDLADQFLQLDGKKFGFTLISDVEYEQFRLTPTADEALLSFLHTLSSRRVFEDTLLLVMGDHGHRYSKFRNTYQGKLEERLPLMAIILPQRLKKLRPEALLSLEHNKNVLATPMDIHSTILDVVNLKNKSNSYILPGSSLPRALSLLEPIPRTRSCGQAGVMPHWCACSKWYNVSQKDPLYQRVPTVLAEFVDSVTQEQRKKCARRWLLRTEWVVRQSASDYMSKLNYFDLKKEAYDIFLKYSSKTINLLDEFLQAKIVMSPDEAEFEGTLVYSNENDFFIITQRDISRVNAYGNMPKCISRTHPHLNKYCYCKAHSKNDSIVF